MAKAPKVDPNLPGGRFKEDTEDYTYLRDVAFLLATERRQKRIVLSGEIISSMDELKNVLTQKLGMQSTNVRAAFRRLDTDYSGKLDRLEFKRFLENLNIHCTISAFNGAFSVLDSDNSGTVEFDEFMKHFGPDIAGAELPVMLDGEARMAARFEELVRQREVRAGGCNFSAEQAKFRLAEKLQTMSSSVRKIFAHANSDYQREGELEGGLSAEEFRQLLFKFNIPMTDPEYAKLYAMLDPDLSGVITYFEFQTAFGDSISGGGPSQVIRWGATAVPNHHKAAKEWSELANFADIASSGPDVQSGGSVVTDEENEKGAGFLVQKASDVNAQHAHRDVGFEKEVEVQRRIEAVMQSYPDLPREEWDKFLNVERQKVLAAVAEEEKLAEKLNKRTSQTSQTSTVASAQKVPLLPVADMVAKARSGCKLTKAEFMLQRRQIRDQAKLPSSSNGKTRHGGMGSPDMSGRMGGLSLMRQAPSTSRTGSGSGSNQGGNSQNSARSRPDEPLHSSRSSQLSQVTPRGNVPVEQQARMRDAMKQAKQRRTAASEIGPWQLLPSVGGGGSAISPVSAPGAMQGERPGLPSTSRLGI